MNPASDNEPKGRDPALLGERERRRRTLRTARAARSARGALEAVGRVLGVRREIVVEGVRYQARPTESDDGRREHAVRFPNAPPMTITPTASRVYADLTPCPQLALARRLGALVRPGSRLLWLRCGTGAGAAEAARLVGPSGGVVAVDPDRESIRYARRRYRPGNIGFEHARESPLSGEFDGSFDAAVVFDDDRPREDNLRELARVVHADGWIALALTGEPADHGWWTPALPVIGRTDAEIGPETLTGRHGDVTFVVLGGAPAP